VRAGAGPGAVGARTRRSASQGRRGCSAPRGRRLRPWRQSRRSSRRPRPLPRPPGTSTGCFDRVLRPGTSTGYWLKVLVEEPGDGDPLRADELTRAHHARWVGPTRVLALQRHVARPRDRELVRRAADEVVGLAVGHGERVLDELLALPSAAGRRFAWFDSELASAVASATGEPESVPGHPRRQGLRGGHVAPEARGCGRARLLVVHGPHSFRLPAGCSSVDRVDGTR
jgi:hypothetical protein